TSSKDWNKVLLGLQNNQVAVEPVKKNNKGKFLWLLLLLPLGLICNELVLQGDSDKIKTTNEQQSSSGKSVQTETNPINNTSTTSGNTEPGNPEEQTNTVQQKTGLTNSGIEKRSSSNPLSVKNSIVNTRYNKSSKSNSLNTTSRNIGSKQNRNQIPGTDKTDLSITSQTRLNSGARDDLFTKRFEEREPYQLSVTTLNASNKNIVETELNTKTVNKKVKKFYVGLMGGVDVTTIKFQKIEDAGYDFGILLGYELNKKWSIETGVFMDKKFYYTDGEYFNTSKVWMPPNSKITAVSGNCRMFEIPLTVKYTISSSQKRSWFATAGATSYLMQEEDYDYTYYYGNSGNSATHNRKYDSDSKHFFAAVHISGGYARKINKTTDLRIEPYIKLPVSGMGIGQLRLISTGIHLGITRKLF
ncbi:MAG: outer membrane beta-barrel protein, partial [Flavisolibacter sp.]